MAMLSFSHAEKVFIVHGVEDNIRTDGRSRLEYRSCELETGTVSNATGSARLRLANTDVLVGVKAELEVPTLQRPLEGRIEFFVDCSANAAPEFEGRGGEELASDISSTMTRAFADPNTLDMKSLCVAESQHCWILYIDILLLEVGGNLYDAVSMAVKAALFDTKIPNLMLTPNEEGKVEVDISDDPYDYKQMDVENIPLLVTCCKVGKAYVIDPMIDEESCSQCRLITSVTQTGHVTFTKKIGVGSLIAENMVDMVSTAREIGMALNKALLNKLQQEQLIENRKYSGFLK